MIAICRHCHRQFPVVSVEHGQEVLAAHVRDGSHPEFTRDLDIEALARGVGVLTRPRSNP